MDKDLINHERRVAYLSLLIAQKMGLPSEERRIVVLAGFYHDIGKVKIPDIVLKEKKIKKIERELLRVHPIIGYALLVQKGGIYAVVAPFVLFHHERWDGKGYPFGIKGEKIPLVSRIISVADVYDAMISRRDYKKRFSKHYVKMFMLNNKGRMFDPEIVDVFFTVTLFHL